jgi:hypothetical protein
MMAEEGNRQWIIYEYHFLRQRLSTKICRGRIMNNKKEIILLFPRWSFLFICSFNDTDIRNEVIECRMRQLVIILNVSQCQLGNSFSENDL